MQRAIRMGALAVSAASMLALLACGGDDTSDTSSSSSTTSTSSGGMTGSGGTSGAGGGGAGGTGSGGFGGSGMGFALRFYGNGTGDIDRVKIRIDDETNNAAGPPHDVGASDFTIEFRMRANAADNDAGAIGCGGYNWINGNIIVDRDRYGQGRAFGLSIGGGVLNWGVINDANVSETICGSTDVLDGQWHHVAVERRRSDGFLWVWVDGNLDASGDGPDGDVSYPDDGIPGNFCGGPCDYSDPFIVIAAEKHDAGPAYPSYSGLFDELRISNMLRYDTSFTPPNAPFAPDANTVGLYHFDEGSGTAAGDSSTIAPVDGVLQVGGTPSGPEWTTVTPFP